MKGIEYIERIKNGFVASVHTMSHKGLIEGHEDLGNPMLCVWERSYEMKSGWLKEKFTAVAICTDKRTSLSTHTVLGYYFESPTKEQLEQLSRVFGIDVSDFQEL